MCFYNQEHPTDPGDSSCNWPHQHPQRRERFLQSAFHWVARPEKLKSIFVNRVNHIFMLSYIINIHALKGWSVSRAAYGMETSLFAAPSPRIACCQTCCFSGFVAISWGFE